MSDFNSYLKDKFPLQVVDEIDDTVVFDIVNRTIIPNNVVDIVVQGDNDSRNIKYRIQKKFENVDLSSKSIVIRYTTPDNESDESFATNLVSEIDFITFEWSISAGVTVESGTVTYDILFYDNDGYKWHTKPATLNVEKGLKTTIIKPQPTTDWIDSWRAEAGNILTQCRNAEAISQQAVDAVKDVEVIKDKVVESSLLATESAIVAENQAERAKSEADRAESIVGFSGSYGDLIDLPNIEGKLLVPGENTYQSLGIQPAGNYVTLLEQTLLDNRVTDIENSYMSKELYDPNKKGIVNRASIADTALSAESIDWDGVENKPQKYTPDSHTHSNYESQISELDAACATLQDGLETANAELGNKANVSQLHSAQILDNWDFRNPINQKGKSTYVNSGYTVDRWILHTTNGTSGKIEIFDRFVRVTKTEAIETILLQLIENCKALLGKQACLSWQTPDKIFTDTITIPSATGVSKQMAIGNSGFFADVYFTGTALQFRIGNPRGEIGNYVDIVAAKLELGHVSTLINDPPPHPATELARCQRYQLALNQYQIWRAVQITEGYIDFNISTPTTLRIHPICTNQNLVVSAFNVGVVNGFTFNVAAFDPSSVRIRATKPAHGLTDAYLEVPYGGTILDANL